MKSETLFNITFVCVIIIILSFSVAITYDLNQAEKTCEKLKSAKDCYYEICMAKEYESNNRVQSAKNCIFLLEYDTKRGKI